jgi:hypothetical protein
VIDFNSAQGNLWGMSESWFDSEEVARSSQAKHRDNVEFAKLIDEWHNLWIGRFHYNLEEKRLLERPDWKSLKSGIKRVSLLVPRDGMDLEATWKYWVNDFGPRHVGPGQIMTCINRVIQATEGGKLWGLAEGWYETIEDIHKVGASHQSNPEMKKLVDQWHNQWASHTAYIMEERVLYQR